MVGRIVVWLPWILAEASLGWLEVRLWPDDGLWLTVTWTAILVVFRGVVALASSRVARLLLDLTFAWFCALAVFEAGWYVLPAVAAFAVCDLAGLKIRLPAIPRDVRGYELRLAIAATIVGWVGLAIAVSGPLYASETTVVEPDGSIVTVHSPPPLLQAGVAPPLAVALVIVAMLFGAVALTAAVHVRTGRRGAWLALVASTVLLAIAGVLTVITLGSSLLWLVPGVALAAAAAASPTNGISRIRSPDAA